MIYPAITLCQIFEQTAGRCAAETALVYFGARISYQALHNHVQRVAAGLKALGVQKGDRLALMMPNCPQFVIGYFGALRAGAIVTATSAMYTAREAAHQWNDAGIRVLIVDRRLYPVAKEALPHLPTLRQIVLTGMRQYAPRSLDRLRHALDARATVRARKSEANGAERSGSPKVCEWEELLRLSAKPGPDLAKPEDIACLQYTGGTTGTSKGAMLTHANLVINACQSRPFLKSGAEQQELMVAALPLFHIYAMLCVMITSVMIGGAIIILPRFELRAALNAIRKYRPTIFHGVPTMYVAFNNAANIRRYGLHTLRLCTSGGAPLPIEVRERFEALTGGKLLEGYGLTETSPVTHFNRPDGLVKSGSIGLPVLDTEARIMDLETGTREMPVGEVGEIAIRGPQVMKGYWNNPAETALVLREGWLYTGDIAKKDADGYYYIVDRKKDMIIAGGYNIYPREVEEVLFECPKIKEAAVIGVPDTYRGETVKAFVVLQDGATATAEEIMAFCRKHLAAYKAPRQVVFRDSLPKSAVGKYLRRELRKL